MADIQFTAKCVITHGQIFPAEYSITPDSKTVYAAVTMEENGQAVPLLVKVENSSPWHAAAMKAAKEAQAAQEPARQETEQPAGEKTSKQPFAGEVLAFTGECPKLQRKDMIYHTKRLGGQAFEAFTTRSTLLVIGEKPGKQKLSKAERWHTKTISWQEWYRRAFGESALPENDAAPEQLRQPVKVPEQKQPTETPQEQAQQAAAVEKPWIGQEITGNGWQILFDGALQRTRVIFTEKPGKEAKAAVQEAGFFWSATMQSWNKKLTCKAFRRAQSLADQLRTICG